MKRINLLPGRKFEECLVSLFIRMLLTFLLSGQDGRQILKVNNAGATFGLRLVLDIQQYDYYGLVTKRAGLKVLIHHHETPPMVEELGFAVGPGTSTFAAVRRGKVRDGR